MNNKHIKQFIGLGGFLISIGLIWFIIKKYDLSNTWEIIKTAPLSIISAMITIYLSTFFFRALRWKLMLLDSKHLRLTLYLKSIVLGFAGNNLIPARGGELVRMEYFSRMTKISRTTSLTSIGLEKVLDAIVLLCFLLLTNLWISDKNGLFFYVIQALSLVFIPLLIFLIVLKLKGQSIIYWLESRNTKIALVLSKQFKRFYAALLFLKADFSTLKIISLSIFIWILEGFVFVLGIHIVGMSNSIFIVGFIALCMVNFGILIPSSPGYIGIFQAAIIIALSSFEIPETKSLAAAIIIHSCQFFPITILGILLFIANMLPTRHAVCE